MPVRRATAAALTAVVAAGAAALAWGALVERNRFWVRHEVLPILEPGSPDIRVLHLADIHLAPWQSRKHEWIRSLASLQPDLVVNTGDNLGHEDAYDALEHTLAPFAGIPGVFVNGSNDYVGPVLKNPFTYFGGPSGRKKHAAALDTERLENYFENTLGWKNLNNSVTQLVVNGSRCEFFGVNDAHRDWDDLAGLPARLEELREGETWGDGRADALDVLSVAVTHAPYRRVLDSFVTNGADLIFAGHTHGGQVRVPGMERALVANCDIPRDKAMGLSVWRHARRAAWLNVSAGIGTSIYAPVRFACRPEAVLVTLTSGDIGYS
ncbi:MAG: metallophosphoesterase [Microbacteriaceae bacterium]